MSSEEKSTASSAVTTSPAVILVAWLVVGIPAAWGIYNTGLNAKKLFTSPPPPATAPATPVAR